MERICQTRLRILGVEWKRLNIASEQSYLETRNPLIWLEEVFLSFFLIVSFIARAADVSRSGGVYGGGGGS